MAIRRLVTGTNAQGKSYFASIGTPPMSFDYEHTPGYRNSFIWSTPPNAVVPASHEDATPHAKMLAPPGGTSLVIITMPPDSVTEEPGYDPVAASAEHMRHNPDSGAVLDEEDLTVHSTDTIDYILMLEGNLWSELDDGQMQELKPGDVLIQNGTRHAWRNKSDKPATFAAFVVGARRIDR